MKEAYNHEEALLKAKQEILKKNGGEETEVKTSEENTLKKNVVLKDGTTITFDFGKLTGNSIIEIKKNYAKLRKKNAAIMEEFDDFYYMLVAEYTSGIYYGKFLNLEYKEFKKVRDLVRDFLGEEE